MEQRHSSALYLALPNLCRAEIASAVARIRADGEESNTGKAIILLIYIASNAGRYDDARLCRNDVLGILGSGFGWKLRRCFRRLADEMVGDTGRFRHFCRERARSCYR